MNPPPPYGPHDAPNASARSWSDQPKRGSHLVHQPDASKLVWQVDLAEEAPRSSWLRVTSR
jgi:hypothetical protein